MLMLHKEGLKKSEILDLFKREDLCLSEKYRDELHRGGNQANHYLEKTYSKASENGYIPQALSDLTLDKVIEDSPPVCYVPSFVDGIEDIGGLVGLTTLLGSPKVGKSTFALQSCAYCTTRQIRALYVDFENGPSLTKARLENIPYDGDKFHYMSLKSFSKAGLKDALDDICVIEDKPALLVVDSIQKLPGDSRDFWSDIREWCYELERIKLTYPVTVLVISEKNRAFYSDTFIGAAKGTSSLEYSSDLLMDLSRDWDTGQLKLQLLLHREVRIDPQENCMWMTMNTQGVIQC